ncbi:tryptophan transporter [Desulfoscipio gibsoniae]|nr:tryptophan transporter [Desulfoscipio gibsoniae]
MNNPVVEQVTSTGMTRSKEIAVVAFLIAIGAVLRMFSPAILGITPNFIIAMYCISILLLRPKLGAALGIGIVAGAISMIFSKSPIPYLNLFSEPAGALMCALLTYYLPEFSIKKYSFKPCLATFLGTLVSGGLYIILNFQLALHLPPAAMKAAFIGVVIPVALINMVMAQALYAPIRKYLFR